MKPLEVALNKRAEVWVEVREALTPFIGSPAVEYPHPVWDKIRFMMGTCTEEQMRKNETYYNAQLPKTEEGCRCTWGGSDECPLHKDEIPF